jgi:two-component system, NtrC family, nitrogen regulation response regulator NtrX
MSPEPRESILVVDDEPGICRSLEIVLRGAGYEVETAATAQAALESLARRGFSLAVVDVRLPDLDGIELIEKAREDDPDLGVVVISGHGTIGDAVRATQLGAYDFLEKPLHRERLLLSVRRALEHRRLSSLSASLRPSEALGEMVGNGPAIEKLREEIRRAAPTQGRILITGESGTGKELVARAIHEISPLKDGPFVKLNCAAIPATLVESELFGYEKGAFTGAASSVRGRFEEAHGGTLLLDEIGDMSLEVQAKLLRVLQDGELRRVGGSRTLTVQVRVVAATNKDLLTEVHEGRFREDLYFRINVVPLEVPPLRERREDIPLLAGHFCRRLGREHGLAVCEVAPGALERLQGYDWPGNVRELKNVLERAIILGGRAGPIEADDLPGYLASPRELTRPTEGETLRDYLRRAERGYVQQVLDEAEWNVTRAAAVLGLERTHLHRKIREHGLRRPRA